LPEPLWRLGHFSNISRYDRYQTYGALDGLIEQPHLTVISDAEAMIVHLQKVSDRVWDHAFPQTLPKYQSFTDKLQYY
jgi:hypothetical protein